MLKRTRTATSLLAATAAASVLALSGCAWWNDMTGGGSAGGPTQHVALSGDNEVPKVASKGSAMGDITVKADGSVSGSIKVTGFAPTAAHIHQAAPGANGPVIVPMTKQGDDTFVFAPNAKMNEAQYAAYKAGNTYVNVHSTANAGGEVRAQLKGQ